MSHQKYTLKKLSFSTHDYEDLVNLFRRDGGNDHIDRQFLEWQYERNPIGKAVGFNAFHNEQLVAHYATIPVLYRIAGIETRGLLSINTRTDSLHQGKGLFTLLAEETYSLAREMGYEFVIGVANDNSVYGFTKKLSFQLVARLETRLLMNLKRISSPTNSLVSRIWNSESLAWRIGNPNNIYYKKAISESVLLYGKSKNFRALIGCLENIEISNNIDSLPFSPNPLKLWIGVDPNIDWKRTINFKVPDRYKSVTLNLIFRNLVKPSLLDPNIVQFWAMDFDSY